MAEPARNARGSVKARVRAELETVRVKSRGILRPAEVVEYARNPSTALHGYFEWKDGRAAESWRRHQARLLIQRFYIRVESRDRPSEVIRVREFTSLRNDRGRDSYRSLNDVRGDPSLYQSLVAQALAEAES